MNEAKGMEVHFMVKAVQTYKTRKKGELNFKKNQLIHVSKTNEAEFVYFGHYHGKQGYRSGWFPYFYVKSLDAPPKTAVEPPSCEEGENLANNSAPSISSAIPSLDPRARREKHSSITRKSRNKIQFNNEGNTEEIAKRMDEQYVLKSGILSKRSQTNLSLWKPLWMVLRPSHLTYFKSAVDKKPLGKLNVDTIKSVSIENGLGDSSQVYCFAINTHSKKHALILSASTLHECEDWMAMLGFAIKGGKPVTAAEQLLKKEERKEEGISVAEIQKLIFTRPKEIILHPDLSHPEYLDHILPRPDADEEGGKPRLQHSKGFRNLPSLPSSLYLKVPVIGKVRAIKGYVGRSVGEMTFRANDEWYLIEKRQEGGWWLGFAKDQFGFFPSSHALFLHPLSIDLQALIDSLAPPGDDGNEGKGEKAEGKGNEGKGSEERDDSPVLDRRRPEKHTTLIQNYQVGELLGVGGFGSVYRGIDVETGVMVAIKQVDLDRVNKKELQTIMGELNLLKVLDHINIVQYKGFIKTTDHINIILDFVEGGSLFSLLNKFGPMHGDLVIRYIKQILEGLDYLHSQSVVHNDIKCGNILITKSGVVKLADFGIASLGENADQNIVTGSPYWMAPEVIQLRGTSPASDIWSLGCTIVELLKGQPPFFELNKMQALFAIVENDIPPLPPHLPPKMEDFLRKCFNKEPELRPTAKQLLTHPLLCANSSDAFNDEDEDDDASDDDDDDGDEVENADGALPLPSTKTPTSSFDSSGDEDEEDEEDEMEEEEEESEEEMQFRREEKDAKELLGWFKAAVDKGNTTHITRLRKAVRQKLLHLRLLRSSDLRYRPVYFLVRNSLRRVDLQFVDQIPVDPAEAAEYENDSDFDE